MFGHGRPCVLVLFFYHGPTLHPHHRGSHKHASLATAVAMVFGSVPFSDVVVSGIGSHVCSEMGLEAVLGPLAVCPSFAIRLGDVLSVC